MATPGNDSSSADPGVDVPRLSAEQSARLLTRAGAFAISGVLLAVAAALSDSHRFAYSYLTGFEFTVTIGIGGLILVLIQHLTRAGWSVAARRSMEWLAGFLPVAAILFVPIALCHGDLYHEWVHPGPDEAAMVAEKRAFLNPPFFFARAAFYFAVWGAISYFYRRNSQRQDTSGDPALTSRMQKFAPPLMFAVAYTMGFSGIDWVMSIKPAWFSTMFAVYLFAGAMTSSLAVLAMLMVTFRSRGFFRRIFTVEHQHDVGKLLFAFVVFYAYISFCQFFLIWYANIPEETNYYHLRFTGTWYSGWKSVSWLLVIGHFAVPFALLLPRTIKRHKAGLFLSAALVLVMHYVDMYWLVMPNLDEKAPSLAWSTLWIDVAGLAAPLGVLCFWLAYRASHDPLFPLQDPRIPETLRVDNGQG